MESPPTAMEHAHAPPGVTNLPTPESIRSLMAASQGPRPLSNLYPYRPSQVGRHLPFPFSESRFPVGQMIRNPGCERSHTGFTALSIDNEDASIEPKTDERRRLTEVHQDLPESPGLVDPGTFTSDYESAAQVTSAAPILAPENAWSGTQQAVSAKRSRKRKAEEISALKKRSTVPSPLDCKPSANLKIDPDEPSDTGSCCICMEDPTEGELASIDGCDHEFCFECIEKWSERENTCPLCKHRFNRINRVDKSRKKKGQKGTKKVKQRDQRADLNAGNALEGLLAGLHQHAGFSSSIARLIFSGLGPSTGAGVIGFGPSPDGSFQSLPVSGRSAHRPRQVRFRIPASRIDNFFSDNDDGSDDESPGYADFVNNMREMNQQRGEVTERHPFAAVFGTFPLASDSSPLSSHDSVTVGSAYAASAAAAAQLSRSFAMNVTRSYATNGHVANAGGTADNALEIASDSDEDEIEIVDVRSGA